MSNLLPRAGWEDLHVPVTAPGIQQMLYTYCSSIIRSCSYFLTHFLSAPGLSYGLQDLLVAAYEL